MRDNCKVRDSHFCIPSPYLMIFIYWSCLSFRYADKLNYTLFIYLNLPFCSSST